MTAHAAPRLDRLVALDQLRGFAILLVVLHHASLAYCRFGHVDHRHYALSTAPIVDPQRWVGFDALVVVNDGFFMPLLFLLSGLFVWRGMSRRGAGAYLAQRLLRLGLPFAIAELTVVPLAYYPSFLQAGGPPGFVHFWLTTVTAGPWPSGPPWFAAVLLLFDAAAAALFVLTGSPIRMRPAVGRTPPGRSFAVLLACSLLAYLPLLAAFGPLRWVSFGPLANQASRAGLYAAYFAAGVVLAGDGRDDLFPLGKTLARRWASWASLAVLAAPAFLFVVVLGSRRSAAGLPAWLGWSVTGTALAGFCAIASFALLALFFRFGGRSGSVSGSLIANSYGIYLLHYPAVTWVQYGLLRVPAGAVVKGLATFILALLASWAGATLLRGLPGVRRAV